MLFAKRARTGELAAVSMGWFVRRAHSLCSLNWKQNFQKPKQAERIDRIAISICNFREHRGDNSHERAAAVLREIEREPKSQSGWEKYH